MSFFSDPLLHTFYHLVGEVRQCICDGPKCGEKEGRSNNRSHEKKKAKWQKQAWEHKGVAEQTD